MQNGGHIDVATRVVKMCGILESKEICHSELSFDVYSCREPLQTFPQPITEEMLKTMNQVD